MASQTPFTAPRLSPLGREVHGVPESIRSGRVVVVGSLNMDLVVRVPHLPRSGETVAARSFATFPGGKGANQAVAAARMGASVGMVGRVGADPFGASLRQALDAEGVDLRWVTPTHDVPTGVASIWVDDRGANSIAIMPGANACLTPRDIEAAAPAFQGASVVLVQLEIPADTAWAALIAAEEAGTAAMLDPAPLHPQARNWLQHVWAVAPNQIEAEAIVGFPVVTVEDGRRACRVLLDKGVRVAIVKMAEQGVVVAERGVGIAYHIPAVPVEPVDTTAAGDAFCGALAAGLARGMPLLTACQLANAAAGLSTTRSGAQPSLPRLEEVEAFLRDYPSPLPTPMSLA